MPKNTTTYRYFLPTAEEYGGADLDTIFARHPDAMVTSEVTWDAFGHGATRRLSPPLTLATYTPAEAEPEPDALAHETALAAVDVADVDDEPLFYFDVEDDRESLADGDADEGADAGEWGGY